ncbi:C-factor isoform X2 [Betta splendens]|uniref:C-factor isoform X2 n=1 Tax=Betta splendens TaxID=158456 RepID=A0A6P7MSZ4_BETSP|nr:C-factor isoform X2 [Betta splendens]
MSGAVNFKECGSVLVTGASRGLGLQIVESLASGGFSPGKIVATARNPERAQKLQELASKHSNIHVIALDVVSQESIEKAAAEVTQLLPEHGLNCLINNAGISVSADFNTAFLPLLRQAASRGGAGGSRSMSIQRAAVINISSVLGSLELNWKAETFNKWYPYKASKCALNMVSRCMALDLEADGILCMAIHPGWVRTDMGGCEAPLSPEESISSTLSVIGGLTEKDHGSFLDYTGEVLPW